MLEIMAPLVLEDDFFLHLFIFVYNLFSLQLQVKLY